MTYKFLKNIGKTYLIKEFLQNLTEIFIVEQNLKYFKTEVTSCFYKVRENEFQFGQGINDVSYVREKFKESFDEIWRTPGIKDTKQRHSVTGARGPTPRRMARRGDGMDARRGQVGKGKAFFYLISEMYELKDLSTL